MAHDEPDFGDAPTLDELLLPEFRPAPDGLDESDLERLRALDGTQVVHDWIVDAKKRGLIAEVEAGDTTMLVMTPAGQEVLDRMFPGVIEVGLPVSQRPRRKVGQWLARRLR